MSVLPSHVSIIQKPELWMDTGAIDQLIAVASSPRCERAVGMPDLHQGRGIPVGAVFAFKDEIHPALIGGDMGCGVGLTVVPKPKKRGDALKRRLPSGSLGFFDDVEDPRSVLTEVWRRGASALADFDFLPKSLQTLAQALPPQPEERPQASRELPEPLTRIHRYLSQLGTSGGGNHFLEVSRVAERISTDPQGEALADELGLTQGAYVVLAHSGSRGLGGDLSEHWRTLTLEREEDQRRYLSELQGAIHYAECNRFILQWIALDALGCAQPNRIAGQLELVHNEVKAYEFEGSPLWLHRKGAAPAERARLTVVLGTRGTRSWVMMGTGEPSCLCSVAHGAGRKMSRSDALAKFKSRFQKQALVKTELGGEVICDQAQLLYEEHPKAYKPIAPVIESLVEAGAAHPIAALEPLLTYKMSEAHS